MRNRKIKATPKKHARERLNRYIDGEHGILRVLILSDIHCYLPAAHARDDENRKKSYFVLRYYMDMVDLE